jgi:hypothetical protein
MTAAADTPTTAARPVPELGPPRAPKLPTVAERTLDNGLRVLAVRRPGVPLAEVRLRIPFAGPSGRSGVAHTAQAQLLGDTLLSGTDRRDAAQLAADVQGSVRKLLGEHRLRPARLGGSVLKRRAARTARAARRGAGPAPASQARGARRARPAREGAGESTAAGQRRRRERCCRMYGDHPTAASCPPRRGRGGQGLPAALAARQAGRPGGAS